MGVGVIFNKYLFIQLHEVLVAVHGSSCLTACGVLAPQPEIEPMSPTLEGGFLRQPGKSLHSPFFKNSLWNIWTSLVAQSVKSLPAEQETTYNAGDGGQSLGPEDPLEEGRENHSSSLAWRIP